MLPTSGVVFSILALIFSFFHYYSYGLSAYVVATIVLGLVVVLGVLVVIAAGKTAAKAAAEAAG